MEFKWMNESTVQTDGDTFTIAAKPNSDFFRGVIDPYAAEPLCDVHDDAPFYYTEVEGDFVMRAKVSHDFTAVYDAATLMVRVNEKCWAKACFESTDFGTRAAVSVVTRELSDDANGCDLEENEIWLQICRVGQTFACHYSIDGEDFRMMRYFVLPAGPVVKAGMVAQSPIGEGGDRVFKHFSIEKRTVGNIRAGK